jgi:hypothetical protein
MGSCAVESLLDSRHLSEGLGFVYIVQSGVTRPLCLRSHLGFNKVTSAMPVKTVMLSTSSNGQDANDKLVLHSSTRDCRTHPKDLNVRFWIRTARSSVWP